jgi:hypothetical protein
MIKCAGARLTAALIIVSSSFGCGGGAGGSPTEPAPVFEQKTETYAGTLKVNEGAAYHFPVINPGNIVARITQLAPVSTVTMGLSLGFWDDATTLCSQEIKDAVALNVALSGSPSGPDEYCVGIFDVGNLQAPIEFTIVVTHY